MWGALLAASMAAWLHQLTAITAGQDILAGHGVRGGKAMIATLRWRLRVTAVHDRSYPACVRAVLVALVPVLVGPRHRAGPVTGLASW